MYIDLYMVFRKHHRYMYGVYPPLGFDRPLWGLVVNRVQTDVSPVLKFHPALVGIRGEQSSNW